MKKYIVVILALCAVSCRHVASHYYTYGAWQLPGDENRVSLKGKPKEVKETLFSDMADTTANATNTFNSYDIWRFDAEGRISYRRFCMADSQCHEATRIYNDNGLQSEMRNSSSKSTNDAPNKPRTVVSTAMPDGRFKEVISADGAVAAKTRFLSFSDSGNVQTIEMSSSPKSDKMDMKVVNHYRNGLIQRTVQYVGKDSSWLQYLYSATGYVDSVLAFNKGVLNSKILYTNNEHGDPVASHTILATGDTANSSSMRYEYDASGNWIKKWEKINLSSAYMPAGRTKGVRYALLVREIKY